MEKLEEKKSWNEKDNMKPTDRVIVVEWQGDGTETPTRFRFDPHDARN